MLLLTIFIVSFWCSVIISVFLLLFRVAKQSYLKPKAFFIKTKVIGYFVCKNHRFKQRTNEAKTKESKFDRSVRALTYLLLASFARSVRQVMNRVFFLPFMAQARSARAMKTRKEKTRIHNLPYGPSKRG